MKENIKFEKLLCSTCGVETNHQKIWKGKENKWEDKDNGLFQIIYYELFQCMGCETPTLRKYDIFSENIDYTGEKDKDGNEIIDIIPTITLWPKRSTLIKKTKEFYDAPPKINRIYRETIELYNNDLPLLCAVGIRAIIEAVCNEESIKGNDLKIKIDELCSAGIIPKKVSSALQANRLIGNASAHEISFFSEDTLILAIDIIESMLDFLYNTETRERILKSKLNKEES